MTYVVTAPIEYTNLSADPPQTVVIEVGEYHDSFEFAHILAALTLVPEAQVATGFDGAA